MELRGRGWGISAAAREVGVSRTAANNWAFGYKVYRKGQVVGAVTPVDRLAVREISARYLSQNERIKIADMHHAGLSVRKIACELGRAPSTVSRELRRNGNKNGYQPFDAHRKAAASRARVHERRVETNPQLCEKVAALLAQRWSPQQISWHLRAKHSDDRSMRLCHESIYQAVYQPNSVLIRPSKVVTARRSPLRTGRDHRRAQQRVQRRRPRFQQPMLSIHQRPFEPEDRSQAGHWEGDLIIGKNGRSAIGTLVERQTRTIRLLRMVERDIEALHAAMIARMADLPPALIRSITWDQGTEMARHVMIAADLGAPIFFCDSHSPWQRGSNEKANGLLRQYFPKATDLSTHSPDYLQAVEEELNNRPRLVLGDQVPSELLAKLLTSTHS